MKISNISGINTETITRKQINVLIAEKNLLVPYCITLERDINSLYTPLLDYTVSANETDKRLKSMQDLKHELNKQRRRISEIDKEIIVLKTPQRRQ